MFDGRERWPEASNFPAPSHTRTSDLETLPGLQQFEHFSPLLDQELPSTNPDVAIESFLLQDSFLQLEQGEVHLQSLTDLGDPEGSSVVPVTHIDVESLDPQTDGEVNIQVGSIQLPQTDALEEEEIQPKDLEALDEDAITKTENVAVLDSFLERPFDPIKTPPVSMVTAPHGSGSEISEAAADSDCVRSEKDSQVGLVELARRKAEKFAADQAAQRKAEKEVGRKRSAEEMEGDEAENEIDQKGRKYQKRLEKNRNSAFVSRIRRRKYTSLLEESLDQTEKEKNMVLEMYKKLKHQYEVVATELNVLKEAARSKVSNINFTGAPIAGNGTTVVKMLTLALIFVAFIPLTTNTATKSTGIGTNYFERVPYSARHHLLDDLHRQSPRLGKMWNLPPGSALARRRKTRFPKLRKLNSGNKHERDKAKLEREKSVLDFLSENSTQLFGPQRAEHVRYIVQRRYEEIEADQEDEKHGSQDHMSGDQAGAETCKFAKNDEADRSEWISTSRVLAMLQRLPGGSDDTLSAELLHFITLHFITEHKLRGRVPGY